MHTLSDYEILEEARHRFREIFDKAPIQHLRFLINQDLEKMSQGTTNGYVLRPIESGQLKQAQTHVQNNFVALGEACKSRNLAGWKWITLFTRGLLLGARMWQLATFHRDEFSLEGYCDLQNVMTVAFNYNLPTLQLSATDEELLELHASDGEDMQVDETVNAGNATSQPLAVTTENGTATGSKESEVTTLVTAPDLREQLNNRRAQRHDIREPSRNRSSHVQRRTERSNNYQGTTRQRIRRKCYKCRQRGHQAERCTNDTVSWAASSNTAGSSRGSATNPARECQL